jgi:Zn-dependent protease
MRWAWKVGNFAGIDLRVHATFLLLLLWVVLAEGFAGRSLQAVLSGVAFIVALFVCVVLHEYGHALTARHYGIKTRDIVLLPIGGVSRFERLPENPWQEFWVAVAGPLVNAAIALVLYAALVLTGGGHFIKSLSLTGGPFLQRMCMANAVLFLFNLIPAFPMDGGRVLRALLATRMDHVQATRAAATVGQGLALVFGLVGLFYDPFLVFIAFFVWIGAAHEAQSVEIKDAFSGIPIRSAMQTHFSTLDTSQHLSDAVRLMLDGTQHDFPVLWGDRVMGILTRANLLTGLQAGGPEQPVTAVMQREFETADPGEMLQTVLARLALTPSKIMPVIEDGKMIGLVSMENIGEYLMVQKALHRRENVHAHNGSGQPAK